MPRPKNLKARQQVAELLARGLTVREIALRLGYSTQWVHVLKADLEQEQKSA